MISLSTVLKQPTPSSRLLLHHHLTRTGLVDFSRRRAATTVQVLQAASSSQQDDVKCLAPSGGPAETGLWLSDRHAFIPAASLPRLWSKGRLLHRPSGILNFSTTSIADNDQNEKGLADTQDESDNNQQQQQNLRHQHHLQDDWNAIREKSKQLKRQGHLATSNMAWSPQQVSMVRNLLESWLHLQAFSDAQRREQALWCTRILQRWIRNAGLRKKKQDKTTADALLSYCCRTLDLWKNYDNASYSEALRAVALLQELCSQVDVAPLNSSKGTTTNDVLDMAFVNVFKVLARHATVETHPSAVEHAMSLWHERSLRHSHLARTSVELWGAFLHVLSRGGSSGDNDLVVEPYWNDMIASGVRPNGMALSMLVAAWGKSGRAEAGPRIEALLTEYADCVDAVCTRVAIHAWGECGLPKRGEAFLWKCLHEQQQQQSTTKVLVDRQAFVEAIKAWNGKIGGGERAEAIVARLQNLYEQQQGTEEEDWQPRSDMYNALLRVWAHTPNSGSHVEQLLRQVLDSEQLHQDGPWAFYELYSTAIVAWKNTRGDQAAPERAEALLNEIRAFAKASSSADRALLLNAGLYARVLQVWTAEKRPQSPDRALALLRQMQDEDDIPATTLVYNCVLHAYAQHGLTEGAEWLLDEMKHEATVNVSAAPDAATYATMLNAYYHSATHNNPSRGGQQRGLELVEELEQAFDRSGGTVVQLRPNEVLYATLIRLLGRHSAEGANRLLDHVQDRHAANPAMNLAVSTQLYNAVLFVWATNRDGVAPQRAEEVLKRMKATTTTTAPDKESYKWVMTTWIRSRRQRYAEQVRRLVDEMIDQKLVNAKEPLTESLIAEIRALLENTFTDTEELQERIDILCKNS